MAGVAPQRGGSNATTVGMLVSIGVAVVLLGVLIFLFTGQEQLRSNEKKARDELARISAGADRDAASKFLGTEASGLGPTMLGSTVKAASMLVGRMTGNANETAKQAADKLDAALAEILAAGKVPNPDQMSQANGAVTIIQQLHSWFVAEKSAKDTALADLTKANADLEAAISADKALKEKFTDDYKKLSDQVAEMEKTKSEFETAKNSDLDSLKKTIDDKANDLASAVKEKTDLQRSYATELTRLDKITEEQRRALGVTKGPGAEGAQALSVARKPVGIVLRAAPGQPIVHVSVGRRDRATLGMTLAVYPPDRKVADSGRGKANLEIVSVGELTSECRVITPASPDDPILKDDLVGNILLSKNGSKRQRFCIIGRFDLNYDGSPDVRGLDAIRAFVQRFGGEIVDTVDASTDYLIVGTPPTDGEPAAKAADEAEPPKAAAKADEPEKPADEGDEDKGDESGDDAEKKPAKAAPKAIAKAQPVDHPAPPRARRATSERAAYEEAVRRADALMIPRLTQDHFFNFIGIEAGPNVAKRVFD